MNMLPFLQWFWVFVFYGFRVGQVLGFEKSLVCENGVTLTAKCSDSLQEMDIYGDIIKLGCFVSPNGKIQNQCSKTAVLEKVSIYALDKIVFDRDVIEEGQLQLYIIAPLWEITSFRNISLDGRKGEDYNTGAANGTMEKPDGDNGNPGMPGGDAGSFIGIGKDFVGGNNLAISANGGDGGSGQDGGNGADGVDGSSAIYDDTYYLNLKTCDSLIANDSETKNLKNNNGLEEDFEIQYLGENAGFPKGFLQPDTTTKGEDYVIYGKAPTAPGKGGNGGQPGKAGNPGSIVLYEVCSSRIGSKVMKHKTIGKSGKKQGKGGKGGKCAAYGYDTVFRRVCDKQDIPGTEYLEKVPGPVGFWTGVANTLLHKFVPPEPLPPIRVHSEYRISNNKPICTDEKSEGEHTKVMAANEILVPQETKNSIDAIPSITDYKQYMSANLNSSSRKEFVKCIEESEEIRSLYKTINFLYELQVLENDFYKKGENDDYSPRYEALLNKIGKYSEIQSVQASRQDIKVLSFLYTAISGRINNIKNKLELNIVIDIDVFLDELDNSLKSLRKDETKYYKIQLINSYKQKYLDYVDSNIKEANGYIKNGILPKLNDNMQNLNGNVEKLIDEVVKLKEDMKKNLKKLKEKREQLKTAILIESVLGVINLVGKAISIIPGPWAQIASSGIGMATDVLQQLIVHKPEIKPYQKLKANIENYGKGQSDLFNQEKSFFELRLDAAYSLANKEPGTYHNLLTKISNIKKELADVKEFKDIQHLRDTVKNEMKILENHSANGKYLSVRLFKSKNKTEVSTSEAKTNEDEEKKDKKKKRTDMIIKALDVPNSAVSLFTKFQESSKQLEEVDETIGNMEEDINKLDEYEKSIKKELFPMLKNMENDLKNVALSLETKSVVALDVTSWKVETVLSDVKSSLRKMTEGFESQELLVEAIKHIEDTMGILFQVYKTIQNMQREKMTANYIADINSADANAIQISNGKLRNATEYASLLIQSNIIIQQHKILVKSFKHHVFPFAKKFFEGLIIPSTLERGQNIVELVDSAERQILHLKNKVKECQIFITKEKEYSGVGPFGTLFRKKLKPFFVWKNKEYKNEIAKLLSGEEIIILADISKSNLKLFAIKFQIVLFYLKAKTKAKQMELEEELNFFNINATHLGYSKYRYQNKTYLIPSEPLNIWHSFMRYENSKLPLHIGGAYNTLLEKDPPVYLLSPYTLWKLQIQKSAINDGGSFDTLLTFKDEVDLELAGKGFYILPKITNAIDYEVDKYYKPLDEKL